MVFKQHVYAQTLSFCVFKIPVKNCGSIVRSTIDFKRLNAPNDRHLGNNGVAFSLLADVCCCVDGIRTGYGAGKAEER